MISKMKQHVTVHLRQTFRGQIVRVSLPQIVGRLSQQLLPPAAAGLPSVSDGTQLNSAPRQYGGSVHRPSPSLVWPQAAVDRHGLLAIVMKR